MPKYIALLTLAFLAPLPTFAFVTETIGPAPNAAGQAWWQPGLVELAKHPSRVYARESEWMESIFFNADDAGIRELLAAFSKTALRDRVVEIKSGAADVHSFDKSAIAHNVALQVPDGVTNALLRDEIEWPEPRLIVYVDGAHAMKPDKIPANLLVQSEIPAFTSIARTTPKRTRYEGQAPDADRLGAAREPAWKRPWVLVRDVKTGACVCIGLVRDDGAFSAWLSDGERAALDAGDMRLVAAWTMAPGEKDTLMRLSFEHAE